MKQASKPLMLERGLNGIRMTPVSKDIRRMMFKVKKPQGTDIARSFDGLNDVRNLELSIQYAKEAGMISQGALSITYSKVPTVDYYIKWPMISSSEAHKRLLSKIWQELGALFPSVK